MFQRKAGVLYLDWGGDFVGTDIYAQSRTALKICAFRCM